MHRITNAEVAERKGLGPITIRWGWRMTIPLLIHILQEGDADGKRFAESELMRLAEFVDESAERNRD